MADEVKLTKRQREMLACINQCDGAEIPKPAWKDAEALLAAKLIGAISGARGPDAYFKRAYSLEVPA